MIIARNELLAALEAVRPGLASKEQIEQSTTFVFKNGRVYSYNDQLAISHAVGGVMEGSVQAKELYTLLKRGADAEINIETTPTELTIKGKRSKAGIALQSEITLPIHEEIAPEGFQILPEGFVAALQFALFSAGTDINKPELTCLHIDNSIVESCDGFRLTQCNMTGVDVLNPFLLPASSCAVICKYNPTHFALDDQWAYFTNAAGTEISCRLGVGEYPDLTPFIEGDFIYPIQFHDDTVHILNRAAVFIDANTFQYVTVNLNSSKMTIRARNSSGWFEETVRVIYKGEAIEFIIDPSFLAKMMPILKTAAMNRDKSMLKFVGDGFVHCCTVATSVSS